MGWLEIWLFVALYSAMVLLYLKNKKSYCEIHGHTKLDMREILFINPGEQKEFIFANLVGNKNSTGRQATVEFCVVCGCLYFETGPFTKPATREVFANDGRQN
jgi:hypothetical protein